MDHEPSARSPERLSLGDHAPMGHAAYARPMTSAARPQLRIEQACDRIGRSQLIQRCLGLLAGGADSPDFIAILGGTHAFPQGDEPSPGQDYWLRVWAARGLLWAGAGDDLDTLRSALKDDSWRVREMTCKVIARHRVGDLLEDVAALESDPIPRVRSAAARALTRIVESES